MCMCVYMHNNNFYFFQCNIALKKSKNIDITLPMQNNALAKSSHIPIGRSIFQRKMPSVGIFVFLPMKLGCIGRYFLPTKSYLGV